MSDSSTSIALLRGINVSGRNKIPMAELRALCAEIGWRDVRSYIQSGNLVFAADDAPAQLEAALEAAIAARFGLRIPVIVRAAAAWPGYIAANPFAGESQREPNRVMLCLTKSPPLDDAAARLQERAADGERIAYAGGALWVYYAQGAGRSKLTPALFDRLAGSPVTARNWRTTLTIGDLAAAG